MAPRRSFSKSEAEFKRQAGSCQAAGLAPRRITTRRWRSATAIRPISNRRKANTELAKINFGYTQVVAPFDGIVTARLVSIGEYVGANNTPTKLATIVQVDPIWVNFNISEQDGASASVPSARGAARRSNEVIQHSGRSRPADRDRVSAQGPSRLRLADRYARRPARSRCAACSKIPRRRCCLAISCVCGCPVRDRTRCWCPIPQSAAIRAAVICWCSMPTTSSSSARSSPASMSG